MNITKEMEDMEMQLALRGQFADTDQYREFKERLEKEGNNLHIRLVPEFPMAKEDLDINNNKDNYDRLSEWYY